MHSAWFLKVFLVKSLYIICDFVYIKETSQVGVGDREQPEADSD